MSGCARRIGGRRALAALVCGAALLGGCTLLADFVDRAADPCEGGTCTDATRVDGEPPDASVPSDASDAGAEGASDASDERDAGYAPCRGLASGEYCARDGLHGYAGPASDLVACDGGAIAAVLSCDGGCLAMPNPFADTCNGCNLKANGDYCGRDIPTFAASLADFFIQCQAGNAVQVIACTHGCASHGAASTCN